MAQSLGNLLVHLHGPEAAKVRFLLPPSSERNRIETLWATALGGDRFCIRSIPYFVPNVHAEDVVYAPAADGIPTFAAVIARSGHATFRVVIEPGFADEEFHRRWPPFAAHGCRYEESRVRWYAIDVPPEADRQLIIQLLEFGAIEGLWCYEEAQRAED